ncbi:MAG: radical SAM family heme chaperone HemW [Opitutales bacterium]|nr:radical SAM family heme chaperone HemW [Opitutales bacterium]
MKTPGTTSSLSVLPPPLDGEPLGLYVHVPFCGTTCDFCAFHQQTPKKGEVRQYLELLARETLLAPLERPVDTIFIGGGTPGLLAPAQIRELGKILGEAYGLPREEWTVEMTPASATPARLAAWKDIGVTRISMGAQSFQPHYLEKLGRMQPREKIFEAFSTARRAGFENINLDLMFALPGQSWEEWEADLREVVALGPEHVSTYCLTFEEDTTLWWKLSRGEIRRDEEREIEFYRETPQWLASEGYFRYEVSNYAREGFACVHNVNTWKMGEWVGLGPSASSQQGGWRGTNRSGLDAWGEDLEGGRRASADRFPVTSLTRALDRLVFGLRMAEGVEEKVLTEILRLAENPVWGSFWEKLQEEGLVGTRRGEGRRYHLSEEGFLLADRIGAEILAAGE